MEKEEENGAKPGLRCIRKRTVEDVIETESEHEPINLEIPNINGKEYKLTITNFDGKLILDFNDRDYTLNIVNGKIRFLRTLYRPNHNHNDVEFLQISIDKSKSGTEEGKIEWRSRSPNENDGWKFYEVEFGAEKVDY